MEPSARAARPLGLRHQFGTDADRHRQGRRHHPGPGADLQAGLRLCAEPPYRRTGLSDRGPAGPEIGGAGRGILADAALRRSAAANHRRQMARRFQSRRLGRLWLLLAHRQRPETRGPLHASQPRRHRWSIRAPSVASAWGGGAVDPVSQTFIVNSSHAVQIYRLLRRADYNNVSTRRSRRIFSDDRQPLWHPALDLSQSDRHAVLEPALRHAVVLRSEDRQAELAKAVRPGAAMGLLHAGSLGQRDRSAHPPSPRAG